MTLMRLRKIMDKEERSELIKKFSHSLASPKDGTKYFTDTTKKTWCEGGREKWIIRYDCSEHDSVWFTETEHFITIYAWLFNVRTLPHRQDWQWTKRRTSFVWSYGLSTSSQHLLRLNSPPYFAILGSVGTSLLVKVCKDILHLLQNTYLEAKSIVLVLVYTILYAMERAVAESKIAPL